MPTYNNNNPMDIIVSEVKLTLRPGLNHTIVVIPSALLASRYNSMGITQTSIFPCYNPLINDHHVVFAFAGDNKTITLNVLQTDYVEIYYGSTNVDIYLQDANNTPPIQVKKDDYYRLRTKWRVETLLIVPEEAGEIFIKELKDEPDFEMWDRGRYALESIKD